MECEPPLACLGGRPAQWFFLSAVTFIIGLFTLGVMQDKPRSNPSPSDSRTPEVTVTISKVLPEKRVADLPPNRKEQHYQSMILAASNRHSVDPALVKAIIMAESNYNPTAISEKGAVGLMQLMPQTAVALGVEDSFDPEHNINGGVKYLKQLLNHFKGDLELAVAAYNAGIGTVVRYQGIPPYKATRYYVKRVFEYYRHYKK